MWAYKSYNPQAPSPPSSPVMTPASPTLDPPKFSFRSLLGGSVKRRTGRVEESEVHDTGKRPMHRNRVSFSPANKARSPSIMSGSSGHSYGTRNSQDSLAKSEAILEEILELLRDMRSEKDNERSSGGNAPLPKSSSSPIGTSKPEADRMLSDKQFGKRSEIPSGRKSPTGSKPDNSIRGQQSRFESTQAGVDHLKISSSNTDLDHGHGTEVARANSKEKKIKEILRGVAHGRLKPRNEASAPPTETINDTVGTRPRRPAGRKRGEHDETVENSDTALDDLLPPRNPRNQAVRKSGAQHPDQADQVDADTARKRHDYDPSKPPQAYDWPTRAEIDQKNDQYHAGLPSGQTGVPVTEGGHAQPRSEAAHHTNAKSRSVTSEGQIQSKTISGRPLLEETMQKIVFPSAPLHSPGETTALDLRQVINLDSAKLHRECVTGESFSTPATSPTKSRYSSESASGNHRVLYEAVCRGLHTCSVLLQDLRANEFYAPSEVHFEAIHLLDWCCSWFEKQEPAHLRASELFHHAIIDDQVRVIEYTAKLQMLLESADRSTCAGDSDVIGAWIQQGTEVKKAFLYLATNATLEYLKTTTWFLSHNIVETLELCTRIVSCDTGNPDLVMAVLPKIRTSISLATPERLARRHGLECRNEAVGLLDILYNLAFDITSGPPVFELPVITEVSEKPSDKPTHKIRQLKSQELCDERSESPTLGRQRTRQVMPRVRTTTSARTVSTNSLGAMAGAPASATTVVTCGNGKPDKVGLSNAENTGTSRIDGTKPNDREQEIALSVDKITSSDRLDGESMAPCPSIPEHNLGGLETPKPKVALVGMLDKPRSSTFARPVGSDFRAPGMNRVDSMAHRERNSRELSEELLSYFPLERDDLEESNDLPSISRLRQVTRRDPRTIVRDEDHSLQTALRKLRSSEEGILPSIMAVHPAGNSDGHRSVPTEHKWTDQENARWLPNEAERAIASSNGNMSANEYSSQEHRAGNQHDHVNPNINGVPSQIIPPPMDSGEEGIRDINTQEYIASIRGPTSEAEHEASELKHDESLSDSHRIVTSSDVRSGKLNSLIRAEQASSSYEGAEDRMDIGQTQAEKDFLAEEAEEQRDALIPPPKVVTSEDIRDQTYDYSRLPKTMESAVLRVETHPGAIVNTDGKIIPVNDEQLHLEAGETLIDGTGRVWNGKGVIEPGRDGSGRFMVYDVDYAQVKREQGKLPGLMPWEENLAPDTPSSPKAITPVHTGDDWSESASSHSDSTSSSAPLPRRSRSPHGNLSPTHYQTNQGAQGDAVQEEHTDGGPLDDIDLRALEEEDNTRPPAVAVDQTLQ